MTGCRNALQYFDVRFVVFPKFIKIGNGVQRQWMKDMIGPYIK